MTNENIFEIAVRGKFRFPYKGMISTEDLWDLSLKNLDSIFKTLNSQVKTINEESLLATKSIEDDELNVKIEIIKYIVSVKLKEENDRLQETSKKAQRQRIMAIIANREDADLQNKSIEDLQAMLNDL